MATRFEFHDRRRRRSADPLVVLRRLADCLAYRPYLIDAALNGDGRAVMIVSEAVRHAFGIDFVTDKPKAMSRLDCVALAHRFDRWVACRWPTAEQNDQWGE